MAMRCLIFVATCALAVATIAPSQGAAQSTEDLSALNQQVGTLYEQGKYGEAIPVAEKALALGEQEFGPNHPNVAMPLYNLAELYRAQGRTAEAEPLYKRSLAINEKALGKDHRHVGTSLNNLAELYRAQGRTAEAEPLYQRSLAILKKALGPAHVVGPDYKEK